MSSANLELDYAIVLQIIEQNEQQDLEYLFEKPGFDRQRIAAILQSLQHKKLINITRKAPYPWASLSSRGKQLVGTMWPEPQ